MRIEYRTPLPRCFTTHPKAAGIVSETDILLTRSSRLAAKLLVFTTPRAMAGFWSAALGKEPLGRGCIGAVTSLQREASKVDASGRIFDTRMQVDPRYFCVIGLTVKHLTMEIICHEATHAGFAYAKRVKRNPWIAAGELDEEGVCYPAGRIAAAINRHCHDKGLFER